MRQIPKRLLQFLFRLPTENLPLPLGIGWRLGQLIGINSHVPWPVHFTTVVRQPRRVKLGRATYPGDSPGCYIQAANGIIIGDYANLGPGVGLISANHDPQDNSKWLKAPPIRIGAHCWIGMHAIILPGVELGPHTVVGAGAIVTRSFPEGHCIIAGNPARLIRPL
jgi:acetyltransferase-like isoleucine patch superfamily enzyme